MNEESTHVDCFWENPNGEYWCRSVRFVTIHDECYVIHEEVCAAFGFDSQAGLALSKAKQSNFQTDEELYLVDPSYAYIVYGCLPEEDTEMPETNNQLFSPERTPQIWPTPTVINLTGSPVTPSSITASSPPASPGSVIKTPVVNLEESAFKYAETFPPGCLFTKEIPVDVDGNVCYGAHLPASVASDERGASLTGIPFFRVNRSWSHFTKWTHKQVSSKWEALKAKVTVRKAYCLGEAVCNNKDCDFFQIYNKMFVQEVRTLYSFHCQ